MKIKVVSIPVSNQEESLKFYTEKLGFIKKQDIPLDEGNRWLTLVSKEEENGAEILLEPSPNHFEASKVYQKALFDAGIPCTQFDVENVNDEYNRLLSLGVKFSMAPTLFGAAKLAILDDTCGNYIQLVELL